MSNQQATLSRASDRSLDAAAQPSRPRRDGLSRAAETRLRAKQRRRCPSAPWIDAQFISIESMDHRGRAIVCRYHDPSVFPPGGAQTLMVRCPMCGVFTPPNAMERGICLDEREATGALESKLGWGRSPSALALEGMKFRRVGVPGVELRAESTAALKREIERARLKAQKAETRKKRNTKRRVLFEK